MSQAILDYISEELSVLDFFDELSGYRFREEYDTFTSGNRNSSSAEWTQTLLIETRTWYAKYNTWWAGDYNDYSSCNGGTFEFDGDEANFKRWYKKRFPKEWAEMKDKLEDSEED
jgi:hypothetical protein